MNLKAYPLDKQKTIKDKLQVIEDTRLEILCIIVDIKNQSDFRLSPGDRMIWRRVIGNADGKTREALMDVNMIAIGLVGGMPGAIVSAAYGIG